MDKIKVFCILYLLNMLTAFGQPLVLTNSYMRPTTSLNGEWSYIVDPYENGYYNYRYEPFDQQEDPGKWAYFMNAKPVDKSDLVEYDFDKADKIQVPGDWNSQKERLFYYEGTVWYKKSFNYQKSKSENRVFLEFGAVNYKSEVYLNGHKLGIHEGGFTSFGYEVTKLLQKEGNFLVVKVDNKRKKEAVPTLNTDWWNYGGITRGVKLIETVPNFLEDYNIHLNPDNPSEIMGTFQLNGNDISQKQIKLTINGFKKPLKMVLTTDQYGYGSFKLEKKKINYWSDQNPYLYTVNIEFGADRLTDKIGFRTISTSGHHILLNGEKIFLKGISIHEENSSRGGRAHTMEDAKRLLTWAKELGCNYVRLAHYPHNEHMVRLADEMGILVWEEIPVYWTISWSNSSTYQNAENQLTSVINRDKNRASVIIWSMANETPVMSARNDFLANLAKKTRSIDPTRLISAALEQSSYKGDESTRTISDPFADVVDILSFNQYIGWYEGTPEKCNEITWKITQDKPVLISEFGAGAKFGLHGDKLTRWTEEYQEYLYAETLKMLDKVPEVQGFSPWILVDFRSPRRPLPEIQDGWNRKGLISEKGDKKKAFFVLRDYYRSKNNPE